LGETATIRTDEEEIMTTHRLSILVLGVALFAAAIPATAADWPTRPVRIVVPAAPGGGTDLIARLIAEKLQVKLRQAMVIENKPGADEIIGEDYVAKATPDGYTVFFSAANIAVNPSLRHRLPFDPVRDFEPVAQIATLPYVLIINPKSPAKSVPELVALSLSRENGLNAAVGGTSNMLVTEMFRLNSNARLTNIPYKGCGPAVTSVLAGDTDLAFCSAPALAQFVLAGRLTALAITGNKRLSMLPDVPTTREMGLPAYDVDLSQWVGAFFPANTPVDITTRLNAEINAALTAPDVIDKLRQLGAEPVANNVAEFTQFYRNELAKYKDIVVRAKVPLED
jgi:tripartite-type tricarboxylate transporter receptor subunit TctC